MNCDFGNSFFAVIVVCNQIIIHEISISRDGKYYIFIIFKIKTAWKPISIWGFLFINDHPNVSLPVEGFG